MIFDTDSSAATREQAPAKWVIMIKVNNCDWLDKTTPSGAERFSICGYWYWFVSFWIMPKRCLSIFLIIVMWLCIVHVTVSIIPNETQLPYTEYKYWLFQKRSWMLCCIQEVFRCCSLDIKWWMLNVKSLRRPGGITPRKTGTFKHYLVKLESHISVTWISIIVLDCNIIDWVLILLIGF